MQKVISSSGFLRCIVAAVIAATMLLASGATADAAGGGERPRFSVTPSDILKPRFAWGKHDYALRCVGESSRLRVQGAKGWRAKVDARRFRPGSFSKRVSLRAGEDITVAFRRAGGDSPKRRFHVRCLPEDFPGYDFSRSGPGGPPFFAIQMGWQYAAIFNGDGAPVWWFKAGGEPDNVQLLPDGTVAFDPVDQITFQTGNYEIRTLTGRLLKIVSAGAGKIADIHELLLLDNGNYVLGRQVEYQADTSPYGGAVDSTVIGIQIQELTPKGRVVWRWNSRDHIGLDETPQRWWDQPILDAQPYDISHWNSVELDDSSMLLSFRHLDAVYKINRKTGNVVWKLGGTETPKSLDIRGDPYADYPLGGQHDARVLPNGTVTIYDNRTGLPEPPRAVRYRIDEDARSARLVQSIVDPDLSFSFCCGSADRLPSRDWLVAWGGNGLIGGYDETGERIFKFSLAVGFSYRANPVEDGALSARELRRAMDVMAAR